MPYELDSDITEGRCSNCEGQAASHEAESCTCILKICKEIEVNGSGLFWGYFQHLPGQTSGNLEEPEPEAETRTKYLSNTNLESYACSKILGEISDFSVTTQKAKF
jgi:hypothetical protein